MTSPPTSDRERIVVRAQLGRTPRDPWRVAARCDHGFPSVIVSPGVLEDGTPFPTWAWLTCPYLTSAASAEESAGGVRKWAARIAGDEVLAARLRDADSELRTRRAAEAPGDDPCVAVGFAGACDPRPVKCLHAHVAFSLVCPGDPIGDELLERHGATCPDARCETLVNPTQAVGLDG